MIKKIDEKRFKEQLYEKQQLVIDLADKLMEAFKDSEVFKTGMSNKLLFLDAMTGIGLFTAKIIYAADKAAHTVLHL